MKIILKLRSIPLGLLKSYLVKVLLSFFLNAQWFMATIGAVIITYNEEKNIVDCIKSVNDWCDEIIVLDSFSKDKTRQLSKKYKKVEFHQHAFDGHIQQKNRAIELSSCDWLICIDADERVSQELADSILKFVKDHPHSPGARIKRLTWHINRFVRHGGWYNARYRLIQKGRGHWTGENPHDFILVDGIKRPTQGPILKGDLVHYSFSDLTQQVDTINRFSSIVAFTRFKNGKSASVLKILLKPLSKFVEIYFFKRGFMDGMVGFIIAVSSSYSTFLKYTKLYELHASKLKRPSNLGADYK